MISIFLFLSEIIRPPEGERNDFFLDFKLLFLRLPVPVPGFTIPDSVQ